MKTYIFSSLIIPAALAANKGINPNPDPNFDPATNAGTFGPFVPVQQAAASATGGPNTVDPQSKQAMQLAISNWMTDTGIVSGFQNAGQGTTDNQAFKQIADGAFKAEVDELAQKAVLDKVIGNDPRVSIANLTLTNGVFQSVVDNLQIMSFQGRTKTNLIDAINQVRCVQILPSIDTYMVVAAEYIGDNAQQRRAVRPTACQQVLANNANNASAFPNVPGTPAGNPQGTGDGNITGVPGVGQMGGGNLPQGTGAGTSSSSSSSNSNTSSSNSNSNSNTSSSSSAGSAANSPLPNQTTPQLGLPGFQSSNSNSGSNAGNGQTGSTGATGATGATGTTGTSGTSGGRKGNGNGGNAGNGNTGAAGTGATGTGGTRGNGGNGNANRGGNAGGANAGNANAGTGGANAGNANAGTGGAAGGATGGRKNRLSPRERRSYF